MKDVLKRLLREGGETAPAILHTYKKLNVTLLFKICYFWKTNHVELYI
jgi:hypothetical protein